MLEAAKEARSTRVEILRFSHVEAASLDEIVSFAKEMNTLLDVINEIHVPVIVAPVDQWKFQSRARVAAIEYDEKAAVWCEVADHMLMQHVAVDLSIALEINGTYGVQYARGMASSRVLDLAAVPGVVEEVDSVGLTHKPIDSCLHRSVMAER